MRAVLIFRNMFVGCVLCACLTRSAIAKPPPDATIHQIHAIMAAREAATYPYWLKFKTTHRIRSRTFWQYSGHGWLLRHANGYVRRAARWRSGIASRSAFIQSQHEAVDEIVDFHQGVPLLKLHRPLHRPSGSQTTEWNGRALQGRFARADDRDFLTPASLGLRWRGRAVSELLTGNMDSLLGEATCTLFGQTSWGEFPCTQVLVEFEGFLPPLLLTLSERHGYFPVRISDYVLLSKADAYRARPEDTRTVNGDQYTPQSHYVVDQLHPIGDAWLAVLGRYEVLRTDHPASITCKVDVDSVEFGAVPPQRYQVPVVTRAAVRYTVRDDPMWFGFREPENRTESGRLPTASESARASGLVEIPPPTAFPLWGYAAIGVLSIFVVIVVGRRRSN